VTQGTLWSIFLALAATIVQVSTAFESGRAAPPVLSLFIMHAATTQKYKSGRGKRARRVYCIEPSLQSTTDVHNRHGSIQGVSVHSVPLRDLDLGLIADRVDIFVAFFCMNQFEEADWFMQKKPVLQ